MSLTGFSRNITLGFIVLFFNKEAVDKILQDPDRKTYASIQTPLIIFAMLILGVLALLTTLGSRSVSVSLVIIAIASGPAYILLLIGTSFYPSIAKRLGSEEEHNKYSSVISTTAIAMAFYNVGFIFLRFIVLDGSGSETIRTIMIIVIALLFILHLFAIHIFVIKETYKFSTGRAAGVVFIYLFAFTILFLIFDLLTSGGLIQ